jgi:hypothetical protein
LIVSSQQIILALFKRQFIKRSNSFINAVSKHWDISEAKQVCRDLQATINAWQTWCLEGTCKAKGIYEVSRRRAMGTVASFLEHSEVAPDYFNSTTGLVWPSNDVRHEVCLPTNTACRTACFVCSSNSGPQQVSETRACNRRDDKCYRIYYGSMSYQDSIPWKRPLCWTGKLLSQT